MKKITLDNRYRSVLHRLDSSVATLQMKLMFCSGFFRFPVQKSSSDDGSGGELRF